MRVLSRGHSRNSGFTLIELLVVVSVIAVLSTLLLPAIGMVRRQAMMAKFSSNLRQVGCALNAYADDNDDFIVPFYLKLKPNRPADVIWYALVADYVGEPDPGDYAATRGIGTDWAKQSTIRNSVLRDPSDRSTEGNGNIQRNVALCGQLTSAPLVAGLCQGITNRRRGSVRSKSEMMLAGPGAANSHVFSNSEWGFGAIFATKRIVALMQPASLYCRYGTSVPLVFLDGHVQSVDTVWLWSQVSIDAATGQSRLLDRDASNP